MTQSDESSLEGKRFNPDNQKLLREIVELAFDYRGDVTIELQSGESIIGYVFSRNSSDPDPFLEMFIEETPTPHKVEYNHIRSIHFSGEDTAFGKSWDAWVKKKEDDLKASATTPS